MKKNSFFSAKNIAFLAVFVALTIVLQCFAGTITVGATSFSLVLVPIVLGGMLLGVWAGALLGFVFGFIVLMYGVSGADAFTAALLAVHPVITSILCIGKGVAAGIVPALVYKLIAGKNAYVAAFVASALSPIVNTGIFIIGALCMSDMFQGAAQEANYDNVFYFLVLSVAGINFLVELGINLVAAPAIYTVERVIENKIVHKVEEKN